MLADARAHRRDLALIIVAGVDDDMMIGIGQRDEIALGVDHHLLDEAGALFEKAAQQVRLARPRIALDEQAGGEQFLNVDGNGAAGTVGRSEEHTSELQSLMRLSYAVFCLKKKKSDNNN